MATITHPSMKRAGDTPVRAAAPKTYIVDDATQKPEQVEDQLKQFEDVAPPVQIVPEKPISDIKKKFEELVFLGKMTKDVQIMDHTFSISTLTHRENNEIVKTLYSAANGADLFTIRAVTMAYALKAIDGVPLEVISASEDGEQSIERKTSFIEDMQLLIVEKLYEEYNSLVEESDKLVEGPEIKK